MAKRQLIRGIALYIALTASHASEPPTTVIIGTPPQPGWSQLTTQQQIILAPLSNEWENMGHVRRKKWLGIAERYPAMQLAEQRRTQERMSEWANLTPEQRAKARGTYKDFSQLPPEQKSAMKQKWEAYSNLPPDEKQRIRESGKSARLLSSSAAEATIIEESGNLPQTVPANSISTIPPTERKQ